MRSSKCRQRKAKLLQILQNQLCQSRMLYSSSAVIVVKVEVQDEEVVLGNASLPRPS
jgi:hypothetical protein